MGKSEIISIPVQQHRIQYNLLCDRSSVNKMFKVLSDYVKGVPFEDNDNDAQNVDDPNKIEVLYNQAAGHTFDGKNVGRISLSYVKMKLFRIMYNLN